uniref:Small ribosomal subunit protein mS25 n=1 Tax=Aceria tosichella TaxID=561515 RepID=A0A6G1S582_9ACAR
MFMWGPAPIRRTIDYLKAGRFIVKDNIQVMEVHYSLHGKRYQTREERNADIFHGLRTFYFWEMPRIQYKNPKLQIVRILDKMPSPFIRFWSDDGKDIIIDCFNQDHRAILERVIRTAGKSEKRLKVEESLVQESVSQDNPALFGHGRERFCACEVPGQHPCPGVIRNPRFDQLEVDIGGGKLV